MATKFSAGRLLPFWVYIVLFKFGAVLHYSVLGVLGLSVLPLWLVGLLVGASSLLQFLLSVPAGVSLDRYGYFRMLGVGTIFFILAALPLLFGLTTPTYLLTLILSSFAWAIFGPGIMGYLLAVVPPALIGRMTALQRIMESIGGTLALVGLSWFIVFPSHIISLIILYPLVGALITLFFVKHEDLKPYQRVERTHRRARSVVNAFRRLHPASTLLALHGFTACTFYGAVWFVVPLLIAMTVTTEPLSIGLAMFDASIIFFAWFLGAVADKHSPKFIVRLALLIFALTSLILSFQLNLWLIPLALIATCGDELANLSLWSMLDKKNAGGGDEGTIAGSVHAARNFGWMAGPMLAGVLYTLSPSLALASASLGLFLTYILSGFMLRRSSR